jgi:DNA polymerase III subunit delta
MSAEKIITAWKNKIFKPIYWLEGEEPFYIDEVTHYAENNILSEAEASFNLSVFYGKDAYWPDIVNACMRYPMFAEKQVVLLKEAQQMKDLDKLEAYIEKPLTSTILVVSYKEKKIDGRSKLAKLLKEKAEVFTTKKIYDNQLPDWVSQLIAAKGYAIASKALLLLVDHIGNDLGRISNEVEKLIINLGDKKNITEDHIEQYIGVSKEFNVFELQDALGEKNTAKAIRIIQYFESNPKAAPIQLVLPSLYNYFAKIISLFGLADKSEQAVKAIFYNNIFAARQALKTMKNYGYQGVEKVILLLHEYNLRSIGVNDIGTTDAGLLKELVMKMVG